MSSSAALRTRRGVTLAVSLAVPATLVVGFGHRGVHMARNVLVPGAGLVDEHLLVGLLFIVLGVAATVAWLRWGADWLVLTVVVGSMAVSGALASAAEHAAAALRPVAAAHEFPLVVLVVGAISWVRSVAGRVPVLGRLLGRRHRRRTGSSDLSTLSPVDRCRAASVLALAGMADDATRAAVLAPDVARRARRIGLLARSRRGGDPFRRDHAAARSAQALLGLLDDDAAARWRADAGRAALGVPCSEPGWVRPLDGTLTALALARAGGDPSPWSAALGRELGLRRGHRPAWWWTPLGIGAGAAPAWEQAAATALARVDGLITTDGDWWALRARALGAAARGGAQPDDERLIAAARLWLTVVDDPEAARIVARPGVRRDPLACALDACARRVWDHRPDASSTAPAIASPTGLLTAPPPITSLATSSATPLATPSATPLAGCAAGAPEGTLLA